MVAWISKVRPLITQLGVLDGALFIISTGAARLSDGRIRLIKYYVYAQPIGRNTGDKLRADPSTVIAPTAAASELTRDFPRPPDVIRRRYEQGAVCLAATVKGVFAGFIWFVCNRYEEDEVRCVYVLQDAQRCVWDFDVYVEPRLRLGRTLARLWHAADRYLSSREVQWSFSRISAFNPASISTHARLGAMRCHALLFLSIGSLQLSWLPQPPFFHLSARDASRPTLRLRVPAREAGR